MIIVFLNKGGLTNDYLTPMQFSKVSKWDLVFEPFALVCFATSKISVALLLLRIVGTLKTWHKRFLYLVMVSVSLLNSVFCILVFVRCEPLRALWGSKVGANCWSLKVLFIYGLVTFSQSGLMEQVLIKYGLIVWSVWNALMDICLALLPVTIIPQLQLSIRKKVGLCILLGLGILAAFSAAFKTSKLASRSRFQLFLWST